MTDKISYQFTAAIWQYAAPQGGWYFVSLPVELSAEIRAHLQWQEEGWGRLKATACINATQWDTAIWFDTKQNTYLLPLKAEVRRKGQLRTGEIVKILLYI